MLSCGWEVTRIWAHRNSFFHMRLSASIPFLHPELSFLGLTIGSGYSLVAGWWPVFFSFLSSLRAHQLTLGRLQTLMTVTSSFTDMAGNTLFLNP